MDAKEYQKLAARTLIEKPKFQISDQEIMAVWDAIGLSGESGEIADHIKKGIFHQHGLDIPKLKEEIGDALWYVAALCTTLEFDLSEIMQKNIEKLKVRYPNGFSVEDSKRRVDLIPTGQDLDQSGPHLWRCVDCGHETWSGPPPEICFYCDGLLFTAIKP